MTQFKLEKLQLPDPGLNIISKEGKLVFYDKIRKKELVLTPEEWVRQHFIHFLTEHLDYPKSLIRIEGSHKSDKLVKRTDILVYSRSVNPLLLVECKAPSVKLSDKTTEQVLIYNKKLNAPFIVITNGLQNFCFTRSAKNENYQFSSYIPSYSQLVSIGLMD